jgi:hypothetical protein
MSAVTLYVYDSSDETKNTPLESCTVFVFSEDGSTFITQGNTTVEGQVVFDLPDATYWVRFFKTGFSFDTGLSVVVEEDSEFEVGGENLDDRPPATLSHLCRVSGFIIGAAGQHLANVTAEFMLNERVRISGGNATGNSKVIVVSNAAGYFEFDLLRGAVYEVVVESYEPDVFVVTVPDKVSTGFTDLIWPYVSRVDLTPSSVSIDEEDEVEVEAEVVLSSGRAAPYKKIQGEAVGSSLVSVSSTDPAVATASMSGSTVTIVGVGAGTCEIEFSSSLAEAERVPAVDVTFDSISVTVA